MNGGLGLYQGLVVLGVLSLRAFIGFIGHLCDSVSFFSLLCLGIFLWIFLFGACIIRMSDDGWDVCIETNTTVNNVLWKYSLI